MKQILADFTASISELKKSPTSLLDEADGAAVAILNHNKPTAYLVPADVYEQMMDLIEDFELSQIIENRRSEFKDAVEVSLDEL